MVDAFFLEVPKDNRKNALAAAPAKGKTGCIFHCTMEMKQPHTITEHKENTFLDNHRKSEHPGSLSPQQKRREALPPFIMQ